jgi:hypothetical protein
MLNSSRMKRYKAVIGLQIMLNPVVAIIKSTSYTVDLAGRYIHTILYRGFPYVFYILISNVFTYGFSNVSAMYGLSDDCFT